MKLKNIIAVCFMVSTLFLNGCSKEKEQSPEETLVIENNEVYEAASKPTQPQIRVYNELTAALKQGLVSEKVAELVAVNFVYNFFTLYQKQGKEEVGGLTYLPKEKQEEFVKYARAKYYDNYDLIVTQFGKDNLPNIIMHEVKQIVPQKLMYNQLTYDGYVVTLDVKYQDSKLPSDALKTKMKVQVINNQGMYQVIAVEDVDSKEVTKDTK